MAKEGITNTSELRKMLIETIGEVKAGTIDAKTARTVATLSTTILQSAKLDLDYLRFNFQQDKIGESGQKVLSLIAENLGALA